MANVLLVLGNGFDLACGLKSSFGDYLDSDFYKPQMDKISAIDDSLKNALRSPAYHGNAIFYNYPFTFDENLTFWDMYFGLSKKVGGDLWCDFETSIKDHIDDSNAYVDGINIYESVQMNRVGKNTYADDKFRNDLLLWKYVEQNKLDDKILLNHLKIYEHRFGKYILDQQQNSTNYKKNAHRLVNSFLNADNDDSVVYINNFNYSDLSFISKDIWHVNGDVDNPIFGIDLPEADPQEPKFKFTKTYRRLELVNKKVYTPTNKKYSKVIVYGHSLNEQDNSYFFSLFNILGLSNDRYYSNNTDKYIEFVYSRFGDRSSEDVRQGVVAAVLKMFYAYNKEVLGQENFRLIDILFSAGAIRFREVDQIDPMDNSTGTIVAN